MWGAPAQADSGPPVIFTPGTGPLGSTLLSAAQFAVLPSDIQAFMSTHHVGDTWTITTSAGVDLSQPIFAAPGPQYFYGWNNASACSSPNDCDSFATRVDIGYAGLGWWTRATSSAVANRLAASGVTVTEIQPELRHHWVSNSVIWPREADFAIFYTSGVSVGTGSVNTWDKSAETSGAFQYVGWFEWTLEDLPIIGPTLFPTASPGYYATFIASQQSRITDNSGRVDSWCLTERIESISFTSTSSPCAYPTNPLP